MKLRTSAEERLFAESVRTAIEGWEPARAPELASWLDDRDDALATRLADAGWVDLWADPGLLGAVVAGAVELGRAIAPACVVDDATLGGALAIDGRARHGTGAQRFAIPLPGEGLAYAVAPPSGLAREPTLDGTGTVRVSVEDPDALPAEEAQHRWRVWTSATLAYLAGVAAEALARSVEHTSSREQFGAPLAALPAVRGRLADAALAVDALELVARASAEGDGLDPPTLLWASAACCEVTATAHQVHGALGFALETGIHRLHRRALAMQSWASAACTAAR